MVVRPTHAYAPRKPAAIKLSWWQSRITTRGGGCERAGGSGTRTPPQRALIRPATVAVATRPPTTVSHVEFRKQTKEQGDCCDNSHHAIVTPTTRWCSTRLGGICKSRSLSSRSLSRSSRGVTAQYAATAPSLSQRQGLCQRSFSRCERLP